MILMIRPPPPFLNNLMIPGTHNNWCNLFLMYICLIEGCMFAFTYYANMPFEHFG